MDLKDEILEKIVDALKAEFNPLKVYLFGSHARGQNSENSDYDIMLVVKSTPLNQIQRQEKVAEILWPFHVAADVLVYTEAEIEEQKQIPSSFVTSTFSEGKIISGS